jgi:hypothetical protein
MSADIVRCRQAISLILRFTALAQLDSNSWHADCIITSMTDEKYSLVLLQLLCLLMFSCGVALLTQHPEWFGA